MTSTNSTTPKGEGVIKFRLDFTPTPAPSLESVAELNAWRQILFRLGLTGRDPARYDGLAYGNVSRRIGKRGFIVSGTGTGAKPCLTPNDYSRVLDFSLAQNWLCAEGLVEPSSEALTHGAVYEANPQAGGVIHVHSPELWRNAQRLGIALTDESIAYGTPEMGQAVGKAAACAAEGIVAMGGHEDGVLAFAETAGQAGLCLLRHLAKAVELEQRGLAATGKEDAQSG